MKPFFQEFCDKVISIDKSIRFAGIADGDGHLMAIAERKGLKPLLNPEERHNMQSQPLLANIHALDGSICLARSIMPCQTTPSSSGRRFPLLTRTVASFMCSCYHLTESQGKACTR